MGKWHVEALKYWAAVTAAKTFGKSVSMESLLRQSVYISFEGYPGMLCAHTIERRPAFCIIHEIPPPSLPLSLSPPFLLRSNRPAGSRLELFSTGSRNCNALARSKLLSLAQLLSCPRPGLILVRADYWPRTISLLKLGT